MVAIKDMLGDGAVVRPDGRAADELRQVRITRHWTDAPEGSVLIECGNTRVMCTASFTPTLPRWRKDSGLGWVTAEYAMLPRATSERTARESVRGKVGGRTQEISRLIGRCLRGVVDMKALGSKWVMPWSKAVKQRSRIRSKGVLSPKLCQNPSDMGGNLRPLAPQRG